MDHQTRDTIAQSLKRQAFRDGYSKGGAHRALVEREGCDPGVLRAIDRRDAEIVVLREMLGKAEQRADAEAANYADAVQRLAWPEDR